MGNFLSNTFCAIFTYVSTIFSRSPRLESSTEFHHQEISCSLTNTTIYRGHRDNTSYKTTYNTNFHRPECKSFEFLEMEKLEEFPLPMGIFAIARDDNHSLNFSENMDRINVMISQKPKFRETEDLYIGAYKTMAFFEEAADTIATEAHNLQTISLNQIDPMNGKEFYFNVTPDSKELFAAIDDNQLYQFILISRTSQRPLHGKIKRRETDKIFVDLFTKYWQSADIYSDIYDLNFKVNRMNFQLQHNALKLISEHHLFPILINNPSYHSQSSHSVEQCPLDNHFQSITNQNELNAEQMQAIENIVNGKYNPLPYLLYGPPGTGKTKTVVAAIEKIVRTTTKKILVCAQSNAVCNEIAERLAKVLRKREMLRMCSASYDLDQISSTIKPFCNIFDGELKYPSLKYLYRFRVLICTLSVSGCLVRARNSILFNPRHFGYVFIDECASAHETMALIPIAGLCTSDGKVNANIVLIGDPKQLDAVAKSHWSTKLGYKTSWFEHLFNSAMYKRHTVTGKFNPTYITQLVKNYRSHGVILKVPNELFYENMLEAHAAPDLVRLEVQGLLSTKFPIIFKSVHGRCKIGDSDTSSYNMDEVNTVIEFVDELLTPNKYSITPSDIGVVSPYKLQCKIIRMHIEKKGYKHITVGSAETFQGQERKVIIISSVGSDRKLGEFIKNPQRFNVMITRAKSLLIVCGNPHLLSKDENWSTLIRCCYRNRCLIQDHKAFHTQKI